MAKNLDGGSGRPGRRAGLVRPDLGTLVPLALALMAEDESRLQRFFALTGLDATSLRQSVAEPGFADALMAHVCDDEGLIVALAERAGCTPDAIVMAASSRAARDAAWESAGAGGDAGEPG